MQTVFERKKVMGSYNRSIKIRKNGSLEIKMYDTPINYTQEGYEEYTQFFDYNIRRGNMQNGMDKQLERKEHNLLSQGRVKSEVYQDTTLKEIRSDSLSRSRQLLIDYASENQDKFHSFITLTFNEEIKDVETANKLFATYRKQVTRYCKNKGEEFYYLGVPEFQKSGRVHYHILTSLRHDVDIDKKVSIKTYNKNKKKYYNIEYYDLKYWNYGYSSSFDLDTTDEKFNLALYIIKYLYKDLDERLFGRTKVLKSNNLEKPNLVKLDKESIVWKTAWNYIFGMVENKKSDIQNINRLERTEDKPYIKSQTILHINLQDYDNILKEILQDDLEF